MGNTTGSIGKPSICQFEKTYKQRQSKKCCPTEASSTSRRPGVRVTRSVADCFRLARHKDDSSSGHNSDPFFNDYQSAYQDNIDQLYSADMWLYGSLQRDQLIRISNPYLYENYDDNSNVQLYRRSWKLEPFPAAVVPGEKRRRCHSETSVARHSVRHNREEKKRLRHDDVRGGMDKRNWLQESKMKLEDLFKKRKGHEDVLLRKGHTKRSHSSLSCIAKPEDFDERPVSSFFEDDLTNSDICKCTNFGSGHKAQCLTKLDPDVWREKLERWAASLQCAIQVIKREEKLRSQINQLQSHREILERQLDEVIAEKERWRRQCMDLQTEKRHSLEMASPCHNCGEMVLPLYFGVLDQEPAMEQKHKAHMAFPQQPGLEDEHEPLDNDNPDHTVEEDNELESTIALLKNAFSSPSIPAQPAVARQVPTLKNGFLDFDLLD